MDLNAVPPLGIEGVDVNDAGTKREGVVAFGAFGVGNFKTKLHKACVAKLFTRNDLVMDAEAIAEVARQLVAQEGVLVRNATGRGDRSRNRKPRHMWSRRWPALPRRELADRRRRGRS